MVKNKSLHRYFIEEAVQLFNAHGKTLEIGSGEWWCYIKESITLNRDTSARPDVIGDAENLPFEEEFGSILCLEVLEHTFNPQKLVQEIHRVLKRGGVEYYWRFHLILRFMMSKITIDLPSKDLSIYSVILMRLALLPMEVYFASLPICFVRQN